MKQLTAIGTPSLFGEPGDDNENEDTTPIFGGTGGRTGYNPSGGAPTASSNLKTGLPSGKMSLFSGGPGQSLGPNGNGNGNGNGAGSILPTWWPWAAAAVGGGALLWYLSSKKGN